MGNQAPGKKIDEKRAEELAVKIRHADKEALREFLFDFAAVFQRIFQRKGLPDADAAWLALTCAEKVCREILAGKYQFQREGGVIAWACSIARLEMIGWYRRTVPTRPIEEYEARLSEKKNSAPYSHLGAGSNPEDSMTPNQTVQVVREAVARLSPGDQAIINLRLLDSTLSYDEIGVRLGIKNGAARVRYCRASERLRQILEADPRAKSILPHTSPKPR